MISIILGSEGIQRARTKAITVGAISLLGSTGVTLVVGIILAGVLARYFSTEEFGLWSILMSLNGIMIIGFDLGFGNALRNKLSQIYHHRESVGEQGIDYFFSVFYWFVFIAGVLIALIFLLKPFIPWGLLFRSTGPEIITSGSSLMTLGASILAVNTAFNLYSSGFFGYQESHWNAFLNTLSRLALLLGILSLVFLKSSFFIINLMFFAITLLLSMVSFYIFLKKRRWKFRLFPFAALKVRININALSLRD